MKIVITDGYTLNPGDLDWKPFHQLGEVTYYDRTAFEDISERCYDADIIVTNKTPINSDVITSAPNLKLIAVTATGYNIIDIAAAKKNNVLVCNVPEYGTHSVAQHTFALILELTNRVGLHSLQVREGAWERSIDWCFARTPLLELKDKTLGIVGMGKIGSQTALIGLAFGMKVIYYRGSANGFEARAVEIKELFSKSDIVSLHCPLRPDNYAFVNNDLLSLMKPSAFLVNTSRGQLIHEEHLAQALQSNMIAGAALDVLSKEPPSADHPLLRLPNCVITPHNAWLSFEARQRILGATFDNVKSMLMGQPKNLVE